MSKPGVSTVLRCAGLSGLMRTLREADRRLEELSSGEETCALGEGESFLLSRMRIDSAVSVPSALPTHVLLVDTQGRSVSVIDGARQMDCLNPLVDTHYGLGLGHGADSDVELCAGLSQIQKVALGIRAVLAGRIPRYSCEYVCRSAALERWYLVTATPLSEEYPAGALVIYLDITGRPAAARPGLCGPAAHGEGIFLVARTGMRMVHVNDSACRMVGKTRERLLEDAASESFATDLAQLESEYDELIDHGPGEPVEMRLSHGMGPDSWVEVRRRAHYTTDGWTIITFMRDITERKVVDHRIAYLSRMHSMLSSIHALIVQEHDRTDLMRKACRIAVKAGGFQLAMMAWVDPASLKTVPVGLASRDQHLLEVVRGMLVSREGAPAGMIDRAVKERRPILSNDSQLDPRVALPHIHAAFGVRSMASLPLIADGAVIGVLSLFADESEFFHTEEVELLTELASDVAFAIAHIDKQRRLDYLARYDELTGLANRVLFMERVTHLLSSTDGDGRVHALLLIDLHGFSNVNDSLGRASGDALLKQVAQWLAANVGKVNSLARIGADRFAAILPSVPFESDLVLYLDKMISAIGSHRFVLGGAEFGIAVRVGVSLFPDAGTDADTLLKHAEAALKRAKSSGDRYLIHTHKMSEAVAGKFSMESRLHQALDRDEFVLFYQPKIALASGRVTGVEALLRWNDPQAGLVMPERFIGILEDTGMIREVGRWVLRKALSDYLRWRRAGLDAVRVAVNVSPLQFRNHAFVREIEEVVGLDALVAAGLELEVTESMIMEDIGHNIESMKAIRSLGVTLAIDDFGTGFSSLSHLAKLPVHTLKIDRSFVNDMGAGPEGLALVSTIVKLGHSMNLTVVAEGVETDNQSRLLRLLGCDEIQGYLSSRPMSSKNFEARYLLALQPG